MAQELSPSEQLSYCTARLECQCEGAKTSIGTAFFFAFPSGTDRHFPVLITNRHVIEGAAQGTFHLTRDDKDGNPRIGDFAKVTLNDFEKRWIPHPDPSIDLCMMLVGPLINAAEAQGEKVFFRSFNPDLIATDDFLAELFPCEEVIMIGYPVGIWDSKNNMPVFRRGIISTPPYLDYEGRTEFMVDMACFPGSSGSPVVLCNIGSYSTRRSALVLGNRVKLLGVLYAGPQFTVEGDVRMVPVPTKTSPVAVSEIPTNLGLVIKAGRILDFQAHLPK